MVLQKSIFLVGILACKSKKVKTNTYMAPHKRTLQLLWRCRITDKGGHAAVD